MGGAGGSDRALADPDAVGAAAGRRLPLDLGVMRRTAGHKKIGEKPVQVRGWRGRAMGAHRAWKMYVTHAQMKVTEVYVGVDEERGKKGRS